MVCFRDIPGGKHAARGGDILSSGAADVCGEVVIEQNLLECQHAFLAGGLQRYQGIGIQRDQIDLLLYPLQQLHQPERVIGRIVDRLRSGHIQK